MPNLMERRKFIKVGALSAPALGIPFSQLNAVAPRSTEINLPPLPFQELKSKLKITEVKMVTPKRKNPGQNTSPVRDPGQQEG